MPTRRSLLRRGAESLTLAGLVSVAGCTDALAPGGDGGDGGGAPGWTGPIYDPASLTTVGVRGFLSYDLGTLWGMRDRFPDRYVSQVEEAASRVQGIDPADVDRVTGVMGGRTTGKQNEPAAGFASAKLSGTFDADSLASQLGVVVGEGESYGDYTIYVPEDIEEETGVATAVGSDALYGGLTTVSDMEPTAPVTTMIDADGEAGYYGASQTGRRLIGELSGSFSVQGVEVDPALVQRVVAGDFGNPVDDERTRAVLTGLRAGGTSTTVDGDTVEGEGVVLYADGEAPSRDIVDELLQEARSEPGSEELLGDVTVERTGSLVRLTARRPMADLFDEPAMALGVMMPAMAFAGTFVLGFGSSVSSGGGVSSNLQAGASVDHDPAADEITVTYSSTAEEGTVLDVRAKVVDGGTGSKGATLESVGDSATLSFPDGAVVQVVVIARNGDRTTVIIEKTDQL